MAFLAIAVALDAGLIGSPFRLRLGSFVRVILRTLIVVGTWFTFGGIELHSLQSVVVVFPYWNIAFCLAISVRRERLSFLFQLSFIDPSIDRDSKFVHLLEFRRAILPGDLIFDIVFQSSIELRGKGFVVPLDLGGQNLEFCFVFRRRGALTKGLYVAFCF
jgi:hypothetical protein